MTTEDDGREGRERRDGLLFVRFVMVAKLYGWIKRVWWFDELLSMLFDCAKECRGNSPKLPDEA